MWVDRRCDAWRRCWVDIVGEASGGVGPARFTYIAGDGPGGVWPGCSTGLRPDGVTRGAGVLSAASNGATVTQTLAIASQKGGTGKTALAASVAPLLALAGQRTLVIDLDQQADLTATFGHGPETLDYSIVDVLAPLNPIQVDRAIVRDVHGVAGLDLLASDLRAAALEKQLAGELMREQKLRHALAPLEGRYDRIVIDCPPSLGDLTINGLCAADEVLVPVGMKDKKAVQGMINLMATITKLRNQSQRVALKAVVCVEVNEVLQTYRSLRGALEGLRLPVAQVGLRAREDWNNANTEDMPVVLWKPSSDAGRDVCALVAELWPELDFPYPSEIRGHLAAHATGQLRAA